jgi:pilus assembly protein Flp/PilA
MARLMRFLKGEEGVTAIEYALIPSLIVFGIIVAVTSMGGSVQNTFNTIAGSLP